MRVLKNRIIIGIVLISFIALSNAEVYILEDMSTNQGSKEINVNDDIDNTQLQPSDSWSNFSFIHIKDNWSTAAGYDWCSGDGSWSNPYILENITIDVANSPTGAGILIEGSVNDYFIISSCTFTNSQPDIVDSAKAIWLKDSNNGTIERNNCTDCRYGVDIMNSNNNSANYNNITYCFYGIEVENADDNNLTSNIIKDCDYGITVYSWRMPGIFDSFNNILKNNKLFNCGVVIGFTHDEALSTSIDLSNKANNRSIYYYIGENSLGSDNFTDAGQVILFYCNNSIISDLNLSHISYGLTLEQCNNNTISRNDLSYNRLQGLALIFSSNNTVSNNSVLNCIRSGIIIGDYSNNNTIANNTFSNGKEAICIGYNNEKNKILNNTMINCGLYIMSFENIIDLRNRVNGKVVYYYKNELGLKAENFTNAGQVFLVNCNDSIIEDLNVSRATQGFTMYYCNNYTVSNITSNFNYENGIKVFKCNNGNITMSLASNNLAGYYISGSNNITLTNNNAFNNKWYGISVSHSNNTNIKSNNVFYNNDGVRLANDCYKGILYNNSIIDNQKNGVHFFVVHNVSIEKNLIINNLNHGIHADLCDQNNFSNNRIYLNEQNGINLECCRNFSLIDNYLINNSNYGLYLEDVNTDGNLIYNNTFANNSIGNAFDAGDFNRWDNGSLGNSWDDYIGKDANDNGRGDTPYTSIAGGSSQDNFPIYWDAPVIDIQEPNNYTYFGNDSPYFFIAEDEGSIDTIWYTLNDSLNKFEYGIFADKINQTEWDTFGDGLIIIHFFFNDSEGYIGTQDHFVQKNTIGPLILINTPKGADPIGRDAPDFEVVITGFSVNITWYSISGWIQNFTFTVNGTLNETAWEAVWDGLSHGDIITITFYANNSLGQESFMSVQVKKYDPPKKDSGTTDGGGDIIFILLIVGIIVGLAVSIIIFKSKSRKKKF